ncbi:MAG: hypothetical protein RSE41_09460, partial [Clostridia bacterium]
MGAIINDKTVSFWEGTQEEYNTIPIDNIKEGRIYFIIDDSNNKNNKIYLGKNILTTEYNLPTEYLEYLESVTYKKPSIYNFSLSPSGNFEVGYELLTDEFIMNYNLTNINNIKSLNFIDYANNKVNISNFNDTIYSFNSIIDTSINSNYKYKLELIDSKDNISYKESNISFMFPILYGCDLNINNDTYNKFKSENNFILSDSIAL